MKKSDIGILGRGMNTPKEVIITGLKDTYSEGRHVHLPWVGKPIPADMEVVYDWILDYEIPFTMYARDEFEVPSVFRNSDFGKIVEGDPLTSIAGACQTLLYLWSDDEQTQRDILRIEECPSSPSLFLDLTNALNPLDIVEVIDDEPVTKYDVEDDDDDDENDGIGDMTREELEVMPAMSVRRYAKAKLGREFTSKQAAIDALFEAPVVEEVSEEDPTDDSPPPVRATGDKERAFSAVQTLLSIVDSLDQTMETQQAHIRIVEASLWLIRLLED